MSRIFARLSAGDRRDLFSDTDLSGKLKTAVNFPLAVGVDVGQAVGVLRRCAV